jgi:hypothetical protein
MWLVVDFALLLRAQSNFTFGEENICKKMKELRSLIGLRTLLWKDRHIQKDAEEVTFACSVRKLLSKR